MELKKLENNAFGPSSISFFLMGTNSMKTPQVAHLLTLLDARLVGTWPERSTLSFHRMELKQVD